MIIMSQPIGDVYMSDDIDQKQACYSFWRSLLFCLIVMTSLMSLTACGKKASKLEPPPDVTEDTFPRTYPDTSLDPKADYVPQKTP